MKETFHRWRLKARRLYLAPVRGTYRRLKMSPLGAALRWAPLQRVKESLRPDMSVVDVLEVLEALRRRGVEAHLMGGWGVDALLGRQSRQHIDLDLICPIECAQGIDAALTDLGYRFAVEEPTFVPECPIPERRVYFDGAERQVDLHLMTRDFSIDVEPLFVTGTIAGSEVSCLSAAAQFAFHTTGYEPSAADGHNLGIIERLRGAGGG